MVGSSPVTSFVPWLSPDEIPCKRWRGWLNIPGLIKMSSLSFFTAVRESETFLFPISLASSAILACMAFRPGKWEEVHGSSSPVESLVKWFRPLQHLYRVIWLHISWKASYSESQWAPSVVPLAKQAWSVLLQLGTTKSVWYSDWQHKQHFHT